MHSVDCRPQISTRDTIGMNISGVVGTYQFIFNTMPTVGGKYYFLHDLYLGNISLINLNDVYTFSIDTNAGSYGTGRFRIYVNNTNPLPVIFGAFDVAKNGKKAQLHWSTLSEINNSFFAVERSSDNCNFMAIGDVQGAGNSNLKNKYSFIDEDPFLEGTNYYRIKQVNTEGKFEYSEIRCLSFNENIHQTVTKVYPNPVSTQIVLSQANLSGQFDVNIYTIEGFFVRSIKGVQTINNELIINLQGIKGGLCSVKANDARRNVLTAKFLVNIF